MLCKKKFLSPFDNTMYFVVYLLTISSFGILKMSAQNITEPILPTTTITPPISRTTPTIPTPPPPTPNTPPPTPPNTPPPTPPNTPPPPTSPNTPLPIPPTPPTNTPSTAIPTPPTNIPSTAPPPTPLTITLPPIQTVPTMISSTTSPWSSWSIVVGCITQNGRSLQLFQRKCNIIIPQKRRRRRDDRIHYQSCVGNTTKSVPCESTQYEPLTESKIAKAKGSITITKIEINGSTVSNKDLYIILNEEEKEFYQLRNSSEISLLALHKKSNPFVEKIIIQKMTVGSLIIDYIIVLKVNNQTVEDLKIVINDSVDFFENTNSPFSAENSEYLVTISDYNECIEDEEACDKNAYCYKFPDKLSYGCQCKDTFSGNGFKCSKGVPMLNSNKLSKGIAVIIFAVLLLFVIIVVAMVIWYVKRNRRHISLKHKSMLATASIPPTPNEKETTFA